MDGQAHGTVQIRKPDMPRAGDEGHKVTKKFARRTEFAVVQRLLRVNSRLAARQCIAGSWARSKPSMDPTEMHRFWKGVFERESEVVAERQDNATILWQLVRPITSQDVAREKILLKNGARGVDSISFWLVRSTPNILLKQLFGMDRTSRKLIPSMLGAPFFNKIFSLATSWDVIGRTSCHNVVVLS